VTTDQISNVKRFYFGTKFRPFSLSKGKMVAQGAHAALECYLQCADRHPKVAKQWLRTGAAKIALKGPEGGGESSLLALQAQASEMGVSAAVIRDAGRTQVERGAATALAVGPAPASVLDEITGHLKLL